MADLDCTRSFVYEGSTDIMGYFTRLSLGRF